MVLATMENKIEKTTTLLIEKEDFDKVQAKAKDLEETCRILNLYIDVISADLHCTRVQYEEYDNNILCRMIIEIKHYVQKAVAWIKFKLNREEEDDYEQIH